MAPAEGERHRAASAGRCGQLLVDGVAVHLQDAAEAVEQLDGVLGSASGRVGVGDRRRTTSLVLRMPTRIRTAAPRPVVAGNGPEVALLGFASSRIEHRTARLVAEQLRRAPEVREQMIVQRLQLGRRRADPLRQRRALDADALAGQDLRLAIERQVIGIFAHDHVGDERFGRQSALDQPRWS